MTKSIDHMLLNSRHDLVSILFITLLTVLTSCSGPMEKGHADEIRQEVRSILRTDTTAYIRPLRDELDTLSLSTQEDIRRMYELCNKAAYEKHVHGDNASAQKILGRQLEILRSNGRLNDADKRQIANICINQGSVLIEQGMPVLALDYYKAGLECCTDTAFDIVRARLNNNIAIVYAEGKMLDKAETYFKKALQTNLQRNNHYNLAINYRNLTQLYTLTGQYQNALKSAQSSIDHIDGTSHPDQLAAIRIQQGILYTDLKQYDIAMQRFLSALAQYKELNDTPGVIDTYMQLSQSYLKRNLPDSAIAVASRALRLASDSRRDEDRKDLLLTLSEAHVQKKDYYQANRLRTMSMELEDSLRNEESRLRLSNWNEMDSGILTGRDFEPPHSSFSTVAVILACLLSAALVTLVIVLILLRKRTWTQGVIADAANRDKDAGASHELDLRNRELTIMSLEKVRNQEEIAAICEDLRGVLTELNPKDTAKRARIRGILSRLETHENQNADEEFRQCFERVHPRFYTVLSEKYPDLTARDQRLCAFLYLGLNTKEMAAITSREVRSVESSRNRLRKKLGLDTNDNLTAYLRNLIQD